MNNHKNKYRSEDEKKDLTKRLKIIDGQVNGVIKMISEDRYCDDILIQLAALNKSIKSLGNKLLKTHLETCVVENIKNDHLEIIDEVIDLFGRLN